MKKFILGGVFAVGLITLGILAFVLLVSKAPYSIPADSITRDNLNTFREIGKYRLIEDLDENPYAVDEKIYVAFYTEDGELVEDLENTTQIIIAETEALYNELIKSVEDECNNYKSGTANNVSYYQSDCGDKQYYLYKLDNTIFIAFQVQGNRDDLKDVVNEFAGK